jgi:hypothetical protein
MCLEERRTLQAKLSLVVAHCVYSILTPQKLAYSEERRQDDLHGFELYRLLLFICSWFLD